MPPLKLRSSCDACLAGKTKCNRTKPSCLRCNLRGRPCVYSQCRKTGRPSLKPPGPAQLACAIPNSPGSLSTWSGSMPTYQDTLPRDITGLRNMHAIKPSGSGMIDDGLFNTMHTIGFTHELLDWQYMEEILGRTSGGEHDISRYNLYTDAHQANLLDVPFIRVEESRRVCSPGSPAPSPESPQRPISSAASGSDCGDSVSYPSPLDSDLSSGSSTTVGQEPAVQFDDWPSINLQSLEERRSPRDFRDHEGQETKDSPAPFHEIDAGPPCQRLEPPVLNKSSSSGPRCLFNCHVKLMRQLDYISETGANTTLKSLNLLFSIENRTRFDRGKILLCATCMAKPRSNQTLMMITTVMSNLLDLFERESLLNTCHSEKGFIVPSERGGVGSESLRQRGSATHSSLPSLGRPTRMDETTDLSCSRQLLKIYLDRQIWAVSQLNEIVMQAQNRDATLKVTAELLCDIAKRAHYFYGILTTSDK